MSLIRREAGARDDLFAWWKGTALGPEARFECAPTEAIVVLDAKTEAALSTLQPGTHPLCPVLANYADRDPVLVLFVTTAPVCIEAAGVLEGGPRVELSAQIAVRDPVRAITLLPRMDDDQSPEDWVAEELLLAVGGAAAAHGGTTATLVKDAAAVEALTRRLANQRFEALGIEVLKVSLALST